jgi:hypothetical protein
VGIDPLINHSRIEINVKKIHKGKKIGLEVLKKDKKTSKTSCISVKSLRKLLKKVKSDRKA